MQRRLTAIALTIVLHACGTVENGHRSTAPAPEEPDTSPEPAESTRYTGHDLSIDDAASAPDIVVATFSSIGIASPDAPGEAHYGGAHARIVRALSGTLSGEIELDFIVRTFPTELAEITPPLGEEHIVFLRHQPGGHRAIKILPATRENLSAVEAAL